MPIPIPALLLTAGLGTRLDPLTRVRAKPAVPVAGEPLARRIVRWLVASGVSRITCNLHHLPHTLAAVLGDGGDLGAVIRYSWELPTVLGSAGGPRQALDIVGAEQFLLVNGDTLTDAKLDDVWNAHQQSGALVTMALVANHEPHRYGGVVLNADGTVSRFVRKGEEARGSFHFIGVQVASAEAFAELPVGEPCSTVGGLYDRLIATRTGAIRGVVVEASFLDIGSVADYRRSSAALAQGARDVGARYRCAPSARVARTIIWDDVSIGDDATLDDCIVTDGVSIADGATYAQSVLLVDHHGRLTVLPLSPQ